MRTISLKSVARYVSLSVVSTSERTKAQPTRVCASRGAVCAVAALIGVFWAGHAWADPISFQFTLNVERGLPLDRVNEIFGTTPHPGSTMRAVFTADTPVIPADQNPAPTSGVYSFRGNWAFSTGPSTVRFNPAFFDIGVERNNCCPPNSEDFITVGSRMNISRHQLLVVNVLFRAAAVLTPIPFPAMKPCDALATRPFFWMTACMTPTTPTRLSWREPPA
jgi:hypothetical protein